MASIQTIRLRNKLRRFWAQNKNLISRALLVLIVACSGPYLLESNIGLQAENMLMDQLFRVRGRLAAPDSVVIVALDESSYEELKLSPADPMPRRILAEAVENLKRYQPKFVMMDFIFSRFRPETEEDNQRLADALSLFPSGILQSSVLLSSFSAEGNKVKVVHREIQPEILEAVELNLPLMVRVGRDGVVRQFYFYHGVSGIQMPYADIAKYWNGQEVDWPGYRDYINFYGPPYRIPSVSIVRLLDKENPLDESILKDKIVFIGKHTFTRSGLPIDDTFRSPYGGDMFGIEFHATGVANLIQKSWVRGLSSQDSRMFVGVLAVLMSWVILRLAVWRAFWATLAFIATSLLAAYLMFVHYRYFIPVATICLVVLPAVFTTSACVQYYLWRKELLELEKSLKVELAPK
jgi:CHASE2 domain-containing sensor protein